MSRRQFAKSSNPHRHHHLFGHLILFNQCPSHSITIRRQRQVCPSGYRRTVIINLHEESVTFFSAPPNYHHHILLQILLLLMVYQQHHEHILEGTQGTLDDLHDKYTPCQKRRVEGVVDHGQQVQWWQEEAKTNQNPKNYYVFGHFLWLRATPYYCRLSFLHWTSSTFLMSPVLHPLTWSIV